MEIKAKLSTLASIDDAVPVISRHTILKYFTFVRRKGWIAVDDEPDRWFVIWTNQKNHHNRAGGARCYAVEFRKDTGAPRSDGDWTGAWESAISLWPVTKKDQDKANSIIADITECVDLAYAAYQTR